MASGSLDKEESKEILQRDSGTDSTQREKEIADTIFEKVSNKYEDPGSSDPQIIQRLDSFWDETLKDRRQERELKKTYADAFLVIARWQLVGVFFIVMFTGYRIFEFEKNELSIIIGGTLAEVFGIVSIIAGSLFDRGKMPLPGHKKMERDVKGAFDVFESFRSEKSP